ncbi:GNAT family N-acetyltransferase [Pararhizobium haloflavum]|uniref:GNAT family N-acetyltransferase n=1 Tax=Pararhizobium haloflavum TaxID=2037914 RepID=UPI0012FFF08E|nr:GNAT family N-acetyltransferase [Pararhizobium haloflavum]
MTCDLIEIGPRDTKGHEAFFRFTEEAFTDVSFRLWADRGGWDDRFTVFAMLLDGEIVSTIARTAMRLIVDGMTVDAYQLGAVATRRDMRGRGHLRHLMTHILALPPLDDRPVFVFGNASVTDLYQRFGFERIEQRAFSLDRATNAHAAHALPVLDMASPQDRLTLKAMAATSAPLSQDFCAIDYFPIMLWHLTYFGQQARRIAERNAAVIVSQTGANLKIHDVIAPEPFALDPYFDGLALSDCNAVSFGFDPTSWLESESIDRLRMAPDDGNANPFFARGRPSPHGRVTHYPELAKT